MLYPAAIDAYRKHLMFNSFSAQLFDVPGGGVGTQKGMVDVSVECNFRLISHGSAREEILDHVPLLFQFIHRGVEFALAESIELDALHDVKLPGDVANRE